MTLSDYYAIAARDIYEGRMDIAVAANDSGCNINERALRLAYSRVLNSSAADIAVGSGGVLRLMANRRLGLAYLGRTTREEMDARRRLLAYLALDVRYAECLDAAREAIDRRAAMLADREGTLDCTLISSIITRLDRAMGIDLADAMIAALCYVMRRAMGEIAVVLVVLDYVSAALYYSEIDAA